MLLYTKFETMTILKLRNTVFFQVCSCISTFITELAFLLFYFLELTIDHQL